MTNIQQIEEALIKTLSHNPKEASPEGLQIMGLALLLQRSKYQSMFKDVLDFHNMLGYEPNTTKKRVTIPLQQFRDALLKEEFKEYMDAVKAGDKEKQLDGLIDLIYVAIGTILVHGWDGEAAWHRIQLANMAKIPGIGKRTKDLGVIDALKPPGWVAPDLKDLV